LACYHFILLSTDMNWMSSLTSSGESFYQHFAPKTQANSSQWFLLSISNIVCSLNIVQMILVVRERLVKFMVEISHA